MITSKHHDIVRRHLVKFSQITTKNSKENGGKVRSGKVEVWPKGDPTGDIGKRKQQASYPLPPSEAIDAPQFVDFELCQTYPTFRSRLLAL